MIVVGVCPVYNYKPINLDQARETGKLQREDIVLHIEQLRGQLDELATKSQDRD